jgi:tellurite resistance protein TehA-like permease
MMRHLQQLRNADRQAIASVMGMTVLGAISSAVLLFNLFGPIVGVAGTLLVSFIILAQQIALLERHGTSGLRRHQMGSPIVWLVAVVAMISVIIVASTLGRSSMLPVMVLAVVVVVIASVLQIRKANKRNNLN